MAHSDSANSKSSGDELSYEEVVNLALDDYWSSTQKSMRKTALMYDLPPRTFQRWIKNGHKKFADISLQGEAYFTPEEETKFAQYLLEMNEWAFPLTRAQLSALLVPWLRENSILFVPKAEMKSEEDAAKLYEKGRVWTKHWLEERYFT